MSRFCVFPLRGSRSASSGHRWRAPSTVLGVAARSAAVATVVAAGLIPISAATLRAAAAAPVGNVIYDSLVNPVQADVPSIAFESVNILEFGNKVTLAPTAKPLQSVTVTMVSWGCQSGFYYQTTCVTTPGATFSEPITFNIYTADANNTVGPLIATDTATFAIPYRPSADNVHCMGTDVGKWYDAATKTCQPGFPTNVTFNFAPKNVVLPGTVIFGVSYNTSGAGPDPIGPAPCNTGPGGCPYDYLNLGLSEDSPQITVGSNPLPGTVYWNTPIAGNYCDGGTHGTGTFRLDSPNTAPCWGVNAPYDQAPFYTPSVRFTAAPPPIKPPISPPIEKPPTVPGGAPPQGYWLTAGDGGVFTFGHARFHGSLGNVHLNAPVIGIAAPLSGAGYWLAGKDGGVFSFNTHFYGSLGDVHLAAPIAGIAATPDGLGYYLVGADGGVFTFGDAHFKGSLGNVHLAAPIVGIAVTPNGGGYYLVGKDGGVFTFGDAHFKGALGATPPASPVVGIAVDRSTDGYWLAGANGGIYSFGAPSFGSVANVALHAPVVGIAATEDGLGYRLAGSDGGMFCFGDAHFLGSLGNVALAQPLVGMTSIG
jgi:hypothetical protein